jgi:hypothetical protein
MEKNCNHEFKYFCKECITKLCDKCKIKHIHSKDIIESTFFYSHSKFEFENIKPKIEKLTVFQKFYEVKGFTESILKLKTFYNKLVEYEKDIETIIDNDFTTFTDIIFNCKSILNEDNISNSINTSKEDVVIFELFKKAQPIFNIVKSLDKIIESFNNSADEFIPFFNDLLNYQNERDANCQKMVIRKNSNISQIIQEKLQDQSLKNNVEFSELVNKVKLLEFENQKLLEMNENLIKNLKRDPIQEINLPNNNQLECKIEEFDLYNLYKWSSECLYDHIHKSIIKNCFTSKQIGDIDRIELRPFLKMSFNEIINVIKLKEFDILNYNDPNVFKQFLIETGVLNDLTQSDIFQKIIQTFTDIIKQEIINYIFANIKNVFIKLEGTMLSTYLEKSQKIKSLKVLDLKGVGISDPEMKRIAFIINNSKVTEIFLQNNKITDNGVLLLFDNLSENKLKSIYLNNNNLTEKSLKYFKIIMKDKIKFFVNLKIVSFENNSLNDALSKEHVKEIKKIVKFTIYI